MQNPTGFTDLDRLDSRIPPDSKQVLKTNVERDIPTTSRFLRLLDNRGLITGRECLERRELRLELVDGDTEENPYLAEHPIAGASYIYCPPDEVAAVGSISVLETFQRCGIGTQLKKHLDNHARQDGAACSYTWIASEAGEKLASKTGYRPETDIFGDVDEIWFKQYR